MNKRTAEHLNALRRSSKPLLISENGELCEDRNGKMLIDYSHPRREGIFRALDAAMLSIVPLAVSMEIMAAAAENREAKTSTPDTWIKACSWSGMTLGPEIIEMALPSARLAIEASNAEALRLYEAYRLACSQGVAVPPPEILATEGDD